MSTRARANANPGPLISQVTLA